MSAPVPPALPGPESGDGPLVVGPALAIPRAELETKATRAGGPGGQHVNTSSTRIELRWNVRTSRALNDELRWRLLERLAGRLDAEGAVRVVASEHRSQRQNRDAAEERLAALIRKALVVQKTRKATKPSRAAKARRLDAKRQQSEKKRSRRSRPDE